MRLQPKRACPDKVDYEPLRRSLMRSEALEEKGPRIHRRKRCLPIAKESRLEKGFRDADDIIENRLSLQAEHRCDGAFQQLHCHLRSNGKAYGLLSSQRPMSSIFYLAGAMGLPITSERSSSLHRRAFGVGYPSSWVSELMWLSRQVKTANL